MKFDARPTIEPLESRIAPARIIEVGSPDSQGSELKNDVNYTDSDSEAQDALFLDTEEQILGGDVNIAGKVGKGVVGEKDTFYIRLGAGDRIDIFNGSSNFDEFLRVKSGNIIAFFVDADGDNEVDENELTAISMGKGASFVLYGSVQGDVVANLNERGTPSLADDELDFTGLVSGQQSIGGVEVVNGRIGGSIIAGGSINFVSIEGTVTSILTGDAANSKTIDYFPPVKYGTGGSQTWDAPEGQATLSFTPELGKAGGSIKNVFVHALGDSDSSADPFNGVLKAGGGGTGAAGGSITLVQVTKDADGMLIQAGAGGAGGNGKAGAGGSVSRVYISGTTDATAETVTIRGGNGGESISGAGGAGGSLSNIFVGSRLFGSQPFATDALLADQVIVEAGSGGAGKSGGKGGAVTRADIRVKTLDGAGDEISVLGGAGGAATGVGAKAGAGGDLFDITARNQDLAGSFLYSEMRLQGGAGGSGGGSSAGGKGGSVNKVVLLSWEVQIQGGNGGDGKVGGGAGSLSNLTLEAGEDIHLIGASLDGGLGGKGNAGSGGAGGGISGVIMGDADLAYLAVRGGDAGDAVGGKGGIGGALQNIRVIDGDLSNGAVQTSLAPIEFRSGAGGDGSKGGGAGGNLKGLSVEGKNANVELYSGSGGSVSLGGAGKGGNAGSLETIAVVVSQPVNSLPAYARVEAGVGGAGAGKGGAGGAGGNVKSTTVSGEGDSHIFAGKGGDGQTSGSVAGGAAGAGGSIIVSQVTAASGSGMLIAGDAGDNGAKAGAGGNVTGLDTLSRSGIFARDSILIQAGDGTHGGAGGNIRFIGYGSTTISFSPAPFGDIDILAGDGSAEGKVAGVGGSIFDVSGSLASKDPDQPNATFTTSFLAGKGGASSQKSAAGGSIGEIAIVNGGYDGAILRIQAGDAGNAPSASTGAKGGDVKNVSIGTVAAGSVLRAISAGKGGDAAGKSGAGGSIDGIYAEDLDIGSRNDEPFGIDQMGGLFAGAAGTVGAGGKRGLNGSVSNIVAKGIGAIVAGRDLVPEAASSVSNITLSGSNTLLRENNVFTQPGPFQLSFTAEGVATETTQGAGAVQEVQTLILRDLQTAGVELTFSFGGVSASIPVDGASSLVDIQNALNSISTVQAAGGVTVSSVTNGIQITFNQFNDQVGLISVEGRSETGVFPKTATAQDVEDGLNALPSIKYLGSSFQGGSVDVTGKEGSFTVSFQQNGNVQLLEGIEIFSSNLTELTKGFADEVLSTEIVSGGDAVDVSELQSGEVTVLVSETSAGSAGAPEEQGFTLANVVGIPNGQMQFSFTSKGEFVETVAGTAGTPETQTLDMTGFRADTRSTFTLTYNNITSTTLPANASQAQIQAAVNGMTSFAGANAATVTLAGNLLTIKFNNNGVRNEISASVTSTSALIPVTSDNVGIENALNGMGSVKFTDPIDRMTGAVDVPVPDPLLPNAYFVNFLEEGDQQMIGLKVFANEVQEIDRNEIAADPLAEFTLSFSRLYTATEALKGSNTVKERQDIALGVIDGQSKTSLVFSFKGISTTTALYGNSSALAIQTALRNELGIGLVNVVKSGSTLQISFPTTGDNPNLFTMTATSTSGLLASTADSAAVQAALNGLPTIKGPSGTETVSVSPQVDGDFEVRFNVTGHREMIVAALSTKEVQELDVRTVLHEATGAFRLKYGGDYTDELQPGASVGDVQNALNTLDAIIAAGGVTVSAGSEAGLYNVQFGTKGDQLPITVRLEIDEIQDVDYTPGIPLTVGVNLDFTADEVVQGGTNDQEVQSLTMGSLILNSPDVLYRISIYNSATDTVEVTEPVRGNAGVVEIQQAINNLNIFAPGDVSVEKEADSITFTFGQTGDQASLFTAVATQTTTFDTTPSKTEIETALNAMATVIASGLGGTGGSVEVTMGASSNFEVHFDNAGRDVPTITATQELPLFVSAKPEGTSDRFEIQAFSPSLKGQPLSSAYAIANLIGFYADASEIDANIFHYIRSGVVLTSLDGEFLPGDQPIDGLVFADKMTGITVTPEAYRVGSVFYDWTNII